MKISAMMSSNKLSLFITVFLMFGYRFITASEYDFDVFPVDKCPMSKEEWDKRSHQLQCNQTHGYHCVPNKHLTSLIEFCYPKGARILFESGNCVELAARGTLNQIACKTTFSSGCPDDVFFGLELYKYPKCLAINAELRCFDADVKCILSRVLEGRTNKQNNTRAEKNDVNDTVKHIITTEKVTHNQTTADENDNTVIVLIVLVVLLLMMLLIVFVVIVYLWKTEKICYKERCQKDVEELQPLIETGIYTKTRSVIAYLAHRKGPLNMKEEDSTSQRLPLSLIPTLDELESEVVLGDMELLLLLRRHCVDGASENFTYLFERKILKNVTKSLRIIESRDNNGCTLLHYAAKGGSKDILETLLKHCTEHTIYDTDHFGHTVLHFACKYGKYDLCAYILSDDTYCQRLLTKTSHDDWNAAHFTAVSGNVELFKLLHGKGEIDMQSETKNGLNILHIACMYNNTAFCQALLNMNTKLNLPLGKADVRGWNIAHYAAEVGNKDIFKCFINEEFASQKTCHGRTVLHICCEFGHYELCELILNGSPFINKILRNVDDEGWNALHSAAKGGNLKVFKRIEEALKSEHPLDVFRKETFYFETVLHICCIHKNVDICRYICNKLKSAPEIVNKVSTNRWTAAHYVAVEIKQDGSEEEIIGVLVQAGIDLKSQSNLGKTVLTVAFEYRNDNLIRYLLDNHKELVNINPAKLREAAAHSKIYERMLQMALQKENSH
uniref:Uncharacterized protein LOC111108435 isoform X1 n=2 Tax=Crassostrea virginica TaxID=6565 RepID=A0A8B8BB96_CRAVI|nr:uncharacterized protein LOC111108435 isoform X1 [Crassostrea virginica]XP_022300025.1 uncharacterized protein LOC111108435 isoform X2 [Crassostrea virginica]